MDAALTQTDTIAQAITLVAAMAAVGWVLLGLPLKISTTAAMRFGIANLLLVAANVFAQFRNTNIDAFEYYRNFNLTHVFVLGSAMFFRAGMMRLSNYPCPIGRDFSAMLGITATLLLLGPMLGVDASNLVAAGCILATGYFCLRAGHEGLCSLRKDFNIWVRFAIMWPFGVGGLLFVARAVAIVYSEMISATVSNGEHVEHLNEWLWAQLAVLIVINSSLVGMTVGALLVKVKEQAARLQKILDTAPVGVAVSTGGVIRFTNPRVTELLNMKVGDPAPNALVNPEDKERIVEMLKVEGKVSNMEVQMYCPRRTVRDLLVTYLPTEYDGEPGVLGWMVDITQRKKNEKRIMFNRTVVENSEPMFWADPFTMTVVYANKAGLALMELPLENVIGATIPGHFLGDMSQENMPMLIEKLRDARRPLRYECHHVRNNGDEIDVDVSCYVAEDDERTLLIASMRDITEQKKAEQALQQAIDEQSAIFDSATMGIAFIKDWSIVRANHRLEELFGWGGGELQGQSPRIWYKDIDRLVEGPYADIKRGEIHYSTQELQRRDGTPFWCRLSGSAIDTNDLTRGTVWMFDDVTAERKAADLMRQAKDLAEEATRMKSDFLANMSHEIRTPMNAIIGMSHLALQTELTAKQRNYIEKVDSAARNLLGIINDILDFSKIEAGKMQFEVTEFHLEDVMENLADLCVIKAQDKGLELLFDVGPDVPTALVGDPLRLGQVMLNLVGNAIKFTERGEVTVAIHTVAHDAADKSDSICLRIEIIDSGVGLSEEQRAKLFSAFSQADASTTRKYGGTGLGLTISKRLVELMDGQIGVDSQPGVGSNFHFTARFGVQAEQRVRTRLDADITNLRILVVDDNARAREIMAAILASQKFDATAVASGSEAITALEEAQLAGRPYGLVLMDWVMPGMDGIAAIQRIRADPKLDNTPAFVMVTAHNREELLEQAEGTKIDGLLLKPVGPSAILDSILTALGKEVVRHGRKQQRQADNSEAAQAVRGAYMLLVEDNPVNQELALEILQAAGIRVDVANNGAEAVGWVGRADYDGVLMDCQMPVMDGFEATRQIRADAKFADLPILAMTANAMSSDKEQCAAAGMNDHIGKPIDVNQLFATLARWIKPKNPEGNLAALAGGQVTAQRSDLPSIPSLDLNQAMRRIGGNVKLLRKLINRFAETQADTMSRIRTALDAGEMETATREAHTTKGLAGNIGATQLLALAGTAESALKRGRTEELPSALAAMEHELMVVLAQIADAMGAPDAEPAAASVPLEVDREELAQDLKKLHALLAEDDSRAGKLVDGLSEKLRSVGQGPAAGQIKKLVGRYEFEEALDKLKEAAQALEVAL
jgi:two-component system sensor histidine kinase/response regulator